MRMSKILAIGTLAVGLTFVFSSCGAAKETAQTDNSQTQVQNNGQNPNGGNPGNFSLADLMGEITALKGSEVSLKLATIPPVDPNNPQGPRGQGTRRNGNNPQGQTQPPVQNNQDQTQGQPAQGDNQRRNPGQGGGNAGRQMSFNGEASTLTIPEGIEITKMVRGANGGETVKVALKDLKVGDVLQVWYSDKTSKTISRISIREAFNNKQNPNNTSSGAITQKQ